MGLQDDIGNGIVAAMQNAVTVFNSILGGTGSSLYASYQVVAHDQFQATQSWVIVRPGPSQRINRVGTDYEVIYTYQAEFHIAPVADRGLARTQVSDGFLAAFGEGGDELLSGGHITDTGSKIKTGGGGEVEWTDEPVVPVRRQADIEIVTHEIAVQLWRVA